LSAYADLKDQGDISREQFEEVNKLLDNIENIEYDVLITRLIEIFLNISQKSLDYLH